MLRGSWASSPRAWGVLTMLLATAIVSWAKEQRRQQQRAQPTVESTWKPIAPFLPDQANNEQQDPIIGWSRLISFPPAGPFIKNLTGVSIDLVSYTVTDSGEYPCEKYRQATLDYGMNGAAEHFSAQDAHAIGNAFARVMMGASTAI